MKPREFWVSNLGGKYVVDFDKPDYIKEAKTYHVREVIEAPTDAEIEEAGRYNLFTEDGGENSDVTADWIAGARWAIAKLTGGSK